MGEHGLPAQWARQSLGQLLAAEPDSPSLFICQLGGPGGAIPHPVAQLLAQVPLQRSGAPLVRAGSPMSWVGCLT